MAFCPDNLEWNARIARWRELPKIKCSVCGIPFREIENLGAWQCRQYKVFNYVTNKWVRIPGDHNGPYTVNDNVVVTPSAMQWLLSVKPESKVFTETVIPPRSNGGNALYNVYENVVIQRFDPYAYSKVRQKYSTGRM